jgi:hypothetical protein
VLRVLGVILAAMVLLPGYKLLDPINTGIAGDQFARLGPNQGFVIIVGTVVALLLGGVAYLTLGAARIDRLARWAGKALERPSSLTFATSVAGVAFLATLAFSLLALNGRPALLDSASQLLQARYLASGAWAGPALPAIEFWDFQYMLGTEAGWVSQYPPGHILLLSLGLRLGMVWIVGPTLLAATVFVTAMVGEAILTETRAVARAGALLLALSPFAIAHAGSYMNHVTAALGAAVAVYAALRALRGHWGWACLLGTSIGLMVVTRPLFGLVMGVVATLGSWLLSQRRLVGRELGIRVGAVLAGGAPWAVFLFWYNLRFFGSPFRFGYTASQGTSHGLGFHTDPWGAQYGFIEAIGYTAGELRALSVELLQTPLPALLVIALYAIWVARIPRMAWLLVAWVCAPLVANGFYWHHDLVMGPRMINETAPAWTLLTALAGFGVVDRIRLGRGTRRRDSKPSTSVALSGVSAWLAASFGLAVVMGWGLLGPTRLMGYGLDAVGAGWSQVPPQASEPSLVFVHGSWQGRLGARLAAAGLTSDSLRIALDSNATCDVQVALDSNRIRRDLNFTRGARRVVPTPVPSGGMILMNPGEQSLQGPCEREVVSDGEGVFGLPQLLWQGDLPGLGSSESLYVRDMGPERNRVAIDAFPDRRPMVLSWRSQGAQLELVPYSEGMRRYWGADDGESEGEAE